MVYTWFWTAEKRVIKVKAELPKHVSSCEKITEKFDDSIQTNTGWEKWMQLKFN